MIKNTCYEWILSSNLKDNLKGSLHFNKWKENAYNFGFGEVFLKNKENYKKVNKLWILKYIVLRKHIRKD